MCLQRDCLTIMSSLLCMHARVHTQACNVAAHHCLSRHNGVHASDHTRATTPACMCGMQCKVTVFRVCLGFTVTHKPKVITNLCLEHSVPTGEKSCCCMTAGRLQEVALLKKGKNRARELASKASCIGIWMRSTAHPLTLPIRKWSCVLAEHCLYVIQQLPEEEESLGVAFHIRRLGGAESRKKR